MPAHARNVHRDGYPTCHAAGDCSADQLLPLLLHVPVHTVVCFAPARQLVVDEIRGAVVIPAAADNKHTTSLDYMLCMNDTMMSSYCHAL
jgi:hypothetical protein